MHLAPAPQHTHTRPLLLPCSVYGRPLPLTWAVNRATAGNLEAPVEGARFHRQRCPGSMFTHRAQETCSNHALGRRWRAGGQAACPP